MIKKQIDTDQHTAVMLEEALTSLAIKANGIYVDATFGRGGHTQAILQRLDQNGKVIVIDKDPTAITLAKELRILDPRIHIFHGSYAEIAHFCQETKVSGKVNGILVDLGVSSPQLNIAERGFSFMNDGPLDMRMDPTKGISAAEWLNTADQDSIAYILKTYGEEKLAKKIAQKICTVRIKQPILTTKQLADMIKDFYPITSKKHPATKTFQAIRIYINNELEDLKQLLLQSIALLDHYGRLVVISFHSLEDRLVKQFINWEAKNDHLPIDLPIRQTELLVKPRLKKIGKSQRPSLMEIRQNVRARSAIMRVAEKAC